MSFIALPSPSVGLRPPRERRDFVGANFGQSSSEDTALLIGMLNMISQNRAQEFSQDLATKQFEFTKENSTEQRDLNRMMFEMGLEKDTAEKILTRLQNRSGDFEVNQKKTMEALAIDMNKSRNRFRGELHEIEANLKHYNEGRGDPKVHLEKAMNAFRSMVSKAQPAFAEETNDFGKLGLATALKEGMRMLLPIQDKNVQDLLTSADTTFKPVFEQYNPDQAEMYFNKALSDRSDAFEMVKAARKQAIGNQLYALKGQGHSGTEYAKRASDVINSSGEDIPFPPVSRTFIGDPVNELGALTPPPPRVGLIPKIGEAMERSNEGMGQFLLGDIPPGTGNRTNALIEGALESIAGPRSNRQPFVDLEPSSFGLPGSIIKKLWGNSMFGATPGKQMAGLEQPSTVSSQVETITPRSKDEYQGMFNQGDNWLDRILSSNTFSPDLASSF